jgi:GH35 family endo-1,4-beta-xylanase
MQRLLITAAFCALLPTPAWAISGNALALNTGTTSGSAALLNSNGYAGTYIKLDEAGPVTITVNAQGQGADGVDPRMSLVIGDERMDWTVGTAAANFERTVNLPAGTHFLRTEFNNDLESARSLSINSLDVSGAEISFDNSNTNALAAAATYTEYGRKGPTKLALVGVAPGTEVHVKLKRHAFNFGTAVPNSFTDTLLINNPAPGSDAARFQQALVDNRFTSLSAENGAKWNANEETRDVLTANAVNPNGGPNIPYMDRISDFAQAHDMRYRQHNLIWGPNTSGATGNNNQQPGWAYSMLQNPTAIDVATGKLNSEALRDEITERIGYYAGARANRFYEIDVYNESYHTGSNHTPTALTYWNLYGASGIAEIYKETKDAIEAAGSSAGVFVNEYSVVQQQGGDYYANWYARHIESIQNAGKALYGEAENVVTGIGFQYYASTNLAAHVPARIYATMQNLAVQGLPISLTELGVTGTDNATNEANAAIILEQTARLVFGMPGATGVTLWNLRNTGNVFAPVGTLYDNNWTIRDTAIAWQEMMAEFDTDLTATVGADGTIDFRGFFGEYDVTISDKSYEFELAKGDSRNSLVIAPGDYNADGMVDAADYTIWRDTFGSTDDLRADGNGNESIDEGDYTIWKSKFGSTFGSGGGATSSVPEPSGVACLLVSLVLMLGRRNRVGIVA